MRVQVVSALQAFARKVLEKDPKSKKKPPTSQASARPHRDWLAGAEPEVELALAPTGSPDAAPEAHVQVVVAASRSWEVVAVEAVELLNLLVQRER